jgi:methylase of polypeptide subunit release factors
MKIKNWLKHAQAELSNAGIGSARLDALILLEDEFKKDRAWQTRKQKFQSQGLNV